MGPSGMIIFQKGSNQQQGANSLENGDVSVFLGQGLWMPPYGNREIRNVPIFLKVKKFSFDPVRASLI
jgi:hypothetical protein